MLFIRRCLYRKFDVKYRKETLKVKTGKNALDTTAIHLLYVSALNFGGNQALESQIFRFGRQFFFFVTPKSKDLGLQPYPEI